jgi:hypothetical protein
MNGAAPAPVQNEGSHVQPYPMGIILSWNGSAWTKVKVPKVGATEELASASAAPGGKVTWAFGRSTNSQGVVSNLTLRSG